MLIAAASPALAYDGTYTFSGVLQKYFSLKNQAGLEVGLCSPWKDTTIEAYVRDYERRLIPAIETIMGKEYPIHAFTAESIEDVLSHLRYLHHYSDGTLQHYRYLMWIVYRVGYENNLYEDNIFWDDIEDYTENDPLLKEEQRIEVMTRLRKSFSIDEELRIMNWFCSLSPETATGEDIGLLIMFFEGFRNNEACGTNLSAVHLLEKNLEIPVIDMVMSTKLDTNKVKGSGKTGNAPRVLPLFHALYDFLYKRRLYIEKLIMSGELCLPSNIKDAGELPFVCKGSNYTVRAQSGDLSRAGRALFERIGIKKSVLAKLHQILCSHEFLEMRIEERDPTTYLFRRNIATHLYQLGFTLAEIQYFMGHDIEDPQLSRNMFQDVNRLKTIAEKLRRHPLHHVFSESAIGVRTEIMDSTYQSESVDTASVVWKKESLGKDLLLQLSAKEPGDTISVSINGYDAQISSMVAIESYPLSEYSSEVLIHSSVAAAYMTHYSNCKTEC